MAQPFGATNKPGTCLWCGRKLLAMTKPTRYKYRRGGQDVYDERPSYDPNKHPGLFDTRGCAEQFGVTYAQAGLRLKPISEEEGR